MSQLVREGGQTSTLLFDQCFVVGKITICNRFHEFYPLFQAQLLALVAGSTAQQAKLRALVGATYFPELIGQLGAESLHAMSGDAISPQVVADPYMLARWLVDRYHEGSSFIFHFDEVSSFEAQ
eukprot:m51a1_g3040 hypothetical protein (124) ;mRNA; r:931777-932245